MQRNSVEMPSSRHTKSAQKGGPMMSPYGSKTSQKAKDAARSYRMQTLTASKLKSTNLLGSSAKNASKGTNKLELPYLSNRSSSKPTMMTKSLAIQAKDCKSTTQATLTQSSNFLPSKIGCGVLQNQPLHKPGQVTPVLLNGQTKSVARLYQTGGKEGVQSSETTPSGSSIGNNQVGAGAVKMSATKSPGGNFKHARNVQSMGQMTTLAGGVRKQQFSAK